MDHRLLRHLRPVASRFRRVRLWVTLAGVWLAAAGCGLVLLWLRAQQTLIAPVWGWVLAAVAAVSAAGLATKILLSLRDYHWIALQVERRFPTLRQRLLTAVALQPARGDGQYDYLQQTVIQETLSHAWKNAWTSTVPQRRIFAAQLFHVVSLASLVAVVVLLVRWQPPHAPLATTATADTGGEAFQVSIEPGDAEIEKGTSLIVSARFPGRVPNDVSLTTTSADGEQQTVPMRRSLDDPLFGAPLREVQTDLTYQVRFAGQSSREFRVTVFEYPELVRADALLSFPQYTQMPEKRVEDTRRVTAVEGTRLTWICHLNKPVARAELVAEDGEEVLLLQPSDEGPDAYQVSLELIESRRWTLRLVDDRDRENKLPPQLSVQVLPNEPPQLKLDLAQDARVSPLEEFPVQATAWDDYGLRRFGLSYSIGGQPPREVLLSEQAAPREMRQVEHVIAFEQLEAEPDQLLSYHFWAEDLDAEGQPRRTFSDMFFAEVRHFEEIFREGQPPPGGQQQQQQQGQAAQQAEQLAELQKQIINATWRVVRRETASNLSDTFADDVRLLEESQRQALQQLEELAGQVAAQSSELIEPIRQHMQEAARHLADALKQPSAEPLHDALPPEQAAYQALLALRAREHQVQRGQPSGGSGSSQSAQRFQQQLQQLELKNEDSRYETQSQAQSREDEQQREQRQTLSRLSDLARRQQDLNQRLQELQLALEAAETAQEREELERQLKRLRDQQEQLLRETDELLNRMDQSQDRQSSEQARRNLEQNRENVRQSAEALERGDVSKALTSGTRAEREFERTRDEFRRQTANQFSDRMRDMRDQARQLEEQQQQLGEQLTRDESQRRGSLRDSASRQQLAERFEQQQQDLQELLERMRNTVQDAETAEPLLAQKLYDAFRETRQRRVEEQLKNTDELLQRGFDQEAAELEQAAREGISNLRQNVEQAADSILGDETDALRRAVSELDELSRQLNEEIQRSSPQSGEQQSGEQQSGEQRSGNQQSGQQQPGEQQSGEQQSGNQQSGNQQSGNQQSGNQQSGNQQSGEQQSGEQQSGQQQSGEQQPGEQQSGSQQSGNQQPGEQQSGSQQSGERQPGEQQSGNQQSGNQQSGNQQSGNQQSGNQQSGNQQSGNQQSGEQQSGEQQSGEQQSGNQQSGNQQSGNQQSGNQQSGKQQSGQQQSGGQQSGARRDGGGLQQWAGESLGSAPLTGGDFGPWSDRLRDVEQMVDDPRLREQAARIRDQARQMRLDFKRHSKEPQWPLVRKMIAEPLRELRREVAEELLRRTAERNEVVPIDRDPVPEQFSEQVRRYYERLGSGR